MKVRTFVIALYWLSAQVLCDFSIRREEFEGRNKREKRLERMQSKCFSSGLSKTILRSEAAAVLKRRKREHVFTASNRRYVTLRSRNGMFLQVTKKGIVLGSRERTEFTQMELQVISPTCKQIKSRKTGRYVAITSDGKIIGKRNCDWDTILREEPSPIPPYVTFSSARYPTSYRTDATLLWYVAIGKKRKRASRMLPGNKNAQFTVFIDP